MRAGLGAVIVAALVAVLLAATSLFTVDQRQNALLLQFGEIKRVIQDDPGLHFKWPLIQEVRYFDKRILTLDTPEAERFNTAGNRPVLVDSFVKWRIVDVQRYYVSFQGAERNAVSRLTTVVNSGLREEFGDRTIHEVVSGERDIIMQRMREKVNSVAKTFGIEVIDVRLKRVELPKEVSDAVYRRMESERKRVANEARSTGSGDGEKVRADADRQRQVILAEAYKEAQRVKGEGDARSASIYAKAFSENAEFFSFYRSLEAYRSSFKSRSDVIIVEPTSEFFKYFKSPAPNRTR